MVGDHLVIVNITQVTVENLCQNTGGTQILMDLGSVHTNGLLIIIRSKVQMNVHLGLGTQHINQCNTFFFRIVVILVIVVRTCVIAHQQEHPVFRTVIGQIGKFIVTGAHGVLAIFIFLVGQFHSGGRYVVVDIANLLLQNHHNCFGPVNIVDIDRFSILRIAGSCRYCAGNNNIFVITGRISHIAAQQLTCHIGCGFTVYQPANKLPVIGIGHSHILIQSRVAELTVHDDGLLTVHSTLTRIKGYGVGCDIHSDDRNTVLLFTGEEGARKARVAAIRIRWCSAAVFNRYCGLIQAGAVDGIGDLITAGSRDNRSVRQNEGSHLQAILISLLTAGPGAPNREIAAALAVITDGDGGGDIIARLLGDDMPA